MKIWTKFGRELRGFLALIVSIVNAYGVISIVHEAKLSWLTSTVLGSCEFIGTYVAMKWSLRKIT